MHGEATVTSERHWVEPPVTQAWRLLALCRGVDPELFYNDLTAPNDLPCSECPVKLACLEEGVRGREEGWWGGLDEKGRTRYRKLLRRGATHDVAYAVALGYCIKDKGSR